MRVHWLQHVPFEGLGSIEPWLQARGHALTCARLYAGASPASVDSFDWLVVMGGPMNVYQTRSYPWLLEEKQAIRAAIDAGRRVLGICLGAQLIADVLGAPVTRNQEREIGWFPVEQLGPSPTHPLFADFPERFEAFHWHGDTFALPPGACHVARSLACAQQAFSWGQRVIGLQFHLETTPGSARELIEHARDDLSPGRFVQTELEMLSDGRRFTQLNGLMDRLLARLEAA